MGLGPGAGVGSGESPLLGPRSLRSCGSAFFSRLKTIKANIRAIFPSPEEGEGGLDMEKLKLLL